MQFNSIKFLFCFLPLFLVVYLIFPELWRNGILVLGSLIFLWLGANSSNWWLVLLIGMTILTYLLGLALGKKSYKWLLAFGLLLLAGVLGFFKCYRGGKLLPPGLSFYLFQMAAYLIDVYRGQIQMEQGIIGYSAQIMMFPKLLSGPLMQPRELQRQTWGRGYLHRDLYLGLQELILGLGLKVLLADRVGGLWTQVAVTGYDIISTPLAWMALVAFALQLYFDFFGYSLMAIGLGRMLGFELPQNFRDPYASKTVSEFYRRWHITLGAWFRDYLYIPMGGSRRGTIRTIINLGAVWLFTGLWHGTGWNYLIWAGFVFLLIVNEKLWLGKLMNRSYVLCHIYTVFMILLSWLPFAIRDPGQIAMYIGRLFGICGTVLNPNDFLIWGERYFGVLATGVLLATPLPGKIWRKVREKPVMVLFLFALFWVVIYYISTSKQDPFMYFQY